MDKKGEILKGKLNIIPWSPSGIINEAEFNQIRLSRGLLQIDSSQLFPQLKSFWSILFRELKQEPEFIRAVPSLDFPDGLSRVVPFQVDNELVVIGMDDKTCSLIGSVISDYNESNWIDIVLEYFERRLVATLGKTWVTKEPVKFIYLGAKVSETVEVVGSICLSFGLGGEEGHIWFGMGPAVTDRVDLYWKEKLNESDQSTAQLSDRVEFSVQIGELLVPHSHVTDYLRPGTVIDIEQKNSSSVRILKNNEFFALGTLYSFNGRFAVRIDSFEHDLSNADTWTTRIGIELCSNSITSNQLGQYRQKGAFMLTGTQLDEGVYLKIAGEDSAYGRLGLFEDNLVVTIIER